MTDYSELVKALRWCADESICRDDFSGEKCPYYDVRQDSCSMDDVMHDAAAAIEAVQAEVERLEPKRGEWIDRYDEDDTPFFKRKYVCSACGGWNTYGKSKYCPLCGAKMTEVQDDS